MGEIADMMLDGTLDEETGEFIGAHNLKKYGTESPGFPVSVEREARERRKGNIKKEVKKMGLESTLKGLAENLPKKPKFTHGEKVKYIGKGFNGFTMVSPFGVFQRYDVDPASAWFTYKDNDVLVYVYELEKIETSKPKFTHGGARYLKAPEDKKVNYYGWRMAQDVKALLQAHKEHKTIISWFEAACRHYDEFQKRGEK